MMWIEDKIHKKIPLSSSMIRDQAINFYSCVIDKFEGSSCDKSFKARKEWLKRYKNRFSLHNIKFTASADHQTALQFLF